MLLRALPGAVVLLFLLFYYLTPITREVKGFLCGRERNEKMASTDELHEVQVDIKGNENEAQHGHQMSMRDRDPAAMNDHVKVTNKSRNLTIYFNPFIRVEGPS